METYEPHYMRGLLQNTTHRSAMGHPLQSFFANEPARFSNLVVPMGLYCSNVEQSPPMEFEQLIDTVGDTEHDELLNKVVIVVHNTNNKQRSKKRNSCKKKDATKKRK